MDEKLESQVKLTETGAAANNGNASSVPLELQASGSHGSSPSELLERQKDDLARQRLQRRTRLLYALYWLIGLVIALLMYLGRYNPG